MSMEIAENVALERRKAGLQSGAIKLTGCADLRHAAEPGQADADYLKALLSGLIEPKKP
jgi:hypothetical protein